MIFYIKNFFIGGHMQKLWSFYRNTVAFWKKSRNSCLLIFLNTRTLNTWASRRILFFEFYYYFLLFFQTEKAIHGAGGGCFLLICNQISAKCWKQHWIALKLSYISVLEDARNYINYVYMFYKLHR